jgi:hypothetical protein
VIVAVAVAGVLLLAVTLVAALRKQPLPPDVAAVDSPPPVVAPTPPPVAPKPAAPTTSQPAPPRPAVPPVPQPVPPRPPVSPQPAEPAVTPPRPPVSQPPERPPVLDQFGNPADENAGLGQGGEFKGWTLLFWSGFEAADRVFFPPSNPLWKALEAQGFTVRREFGRFDPAWLKDVDQLWILSTGKLDLPPGITPDLLELGLSQLPASAVPSGFTPAEYRLIVRATLDCVLSPTHPLDERSLRAVVDFVKAGKGLCLLAEDEPFTVEANELARRLFGVGVSGNYIADKVAAVRGRGITAADAKRFGATFEADDHPLLTGVNFLFEGITVSHVGPTDKLDVALRASDGKPLVVASKVPGVRVVIDCGFTRYCHGPTERTSYIRKTAGTVRLAQNIAAFLAGKDAPKKKGP